MCGIFGLTNNHRNYNSGKIFRDLCLLSESRGKEASGFAVVCNNQINVFKTPFPASKMVKNKIFRNEILRYRKSHNETFTGIGHSRLVTNGYEQYENNNQPVIKNGFVVIHNGIIVNQAELWGKYKSEDRTSELDSELIPTILGKYTKEEYNPGNALGLLFTQIYGMTNIGILSSLNQNMILATNNGSIYYINDINSGFFVFASEKYILEKIKINHKLNLQPDSIRQLKANTLISVSLSPLNAVILPIGEEIGNISNLVYPMKIHKIKDITESKNIYINTSLEHNSNKAGQNFSNIYDNRKAEINKMRRCTRCVLPETFPFIEFDENGVCNYCNNYKKQEIKGKEEMLKLADSFRKTNDRPECLMPFSGGRDSSYALHYVVKELGLRPIAFSYDWGMLTDLARRNQARLCGKLGIEHILVSADIRKKRANIRQNVLAWLKKPSLGTVPLFMAGDKQYFYFANQLMKQNDLELSILGENLFETTNFKSGFCGVKPDFNKANTYSLGIQDKIRLISFYGKQYIINPALINSSLLDTLDAFRSYYLIKHRNVNVFNYVKWNESIITETIREEYDWETDPGTETTWRIGDGTAAFYNYIYYMLAGFTENDTFRSNQIREGDLTRAEALQLSAKENEPRFDSIQWYCRTIGIDFENTIGRINGLNALYGRK